MPEGGGHALEGGGAGHHTPAGVLSDTSLDGTPLAGMHTSAYVSIRQHTSAYVSIRMLSDTFLDGTPLAGMHTYAHVCSHMLTYAFQTTLPGRTFRLLTYAAVCGRMLTYADVCVSDDPSWTHFSSRRAHAPQSLSLNVLAGIIMLVP
jgi:hypothetical protein